MPAAGLARRYQGRCISPQAVIEHQPGQGPLGVAQQQPLTGLIWQGRYDVVAQFADERRLADTQALFTDPAFEAQPGCAKHVFGGLRGAAKSAGDRVFGTVFEGCGETQALLAVQLTQGVDGS